MFAFRDTFWSTRGILIFVDIDLKGYKLSCCGSFGLGVFQFYSDCLQKPSPTSEDRKDGKFEFKTSVMQ